MSSTETMPVAEANAGPGATIEAERPVPFTLRVAARWTVIDEMRRVDDGQCLFSQRAPMTGRLATTAGGRDVAFSDLEL